MFDADGVVWRKRGEFMCELAERLDAIVSPCIFHIELEKNLKDVPRISCCTFDNQTVFGSYTV